ncbi:Lrp/AsnC family transcriptional regulator [Globicatella sp. PHS-GS-PNBC-21-1553]|uniref:Lrp/AsnC family transcriptional regulator n=1 Tax=Globicatella sp. PHS-GS-PNBC-21-1553 TaxID=2885764 RepID=UPI00298F2215|nr:Lrp/AsnC family transcriptional regulator [Globicatella sp. PHS-GS-PNBC-21-1553]WPC09292.1 Lrp/AsnC family transcriptional regulator [Globicatella sp. PHS-GS-PNBC-21-1553]
MMDINEKILKLLERDSRLTHHEISVLLGEDEAFITKTIKELEEKNIICGYTTLVNWEKTNSDMVSAIIELRVNPQRGQGFDRIAEKIYNFPEVKAMYLTSGGYDFLIEMQKAPIREIANFVSSRLSIIEEVQSTATHVILKKYKDHDTLFIEKEHDKREFIS